MFNESSLFDVEVSEVDYRLHSLFKLGERGTMDLIFRELGSGILGSSDLQDNWPELGTLEWITFNPNYLIRISTVETFNFSP